MNKSTSKCGSTRERESTITTMVMTMILVVAYDQTKHSQYACHLIKVEIA